MAITAISRDWGVSPSIVRIVTSDNLTAITTAGYLVNQQSNIEALQAGDFEWESTDYILISYLGGEGFFTRDPSTQAFVAASSGGGGLFTSTTTAVSSAQILNMHTTPVLIVPAQGAGKVIVPVQFILNLTYNSVGYINGGDGTIQYGNTGFEFVTDNLPVVFFQLTQSAFMFTQPAYSLFAPFGTSTGAENMPLYLSNKTTALTNGNSDISVTTIYSVQTL